VVCEFFGHDPVKLCRDHLFFELLDLEANFIRRMSKIDLAGSRVEKIKLLVLLENDASARQRRLDAHRRLVVDQVPVNHRLPIRVNKGAVG
jgi:hypothetical protein